MYDKEEVRVAKQSDKKDFYKLWQTCFSDSEAFCDWLFNKRFYPELSACLETPSDGIVSAMQAVPYQFRVRGKEIEGAMLCGVSTDPTHRKKGYMNQIFRFEMNHLFECGKVIAAHTPAVLESYYAFGHFPVADATYFTTDAIPYFASHPQFQVCENLESVLDEVLSSYEDFSQKYSGMIARNKADFLQKRDDYAADGGKFISIVAKNIVLGYAFYYVTEKKVVCVEAVAKAGYYYALLEAIFSQYEGFAFSIKLPPELYLGYSFGKVQKIPKGVAGAVNIPRMLKELGISFDGAITVTDDVINENNGVFDFAGNISRETPILKIPAGRLLQVLVGYHSLGEITHCCEIYDANAFEELNRLLPKTNCYIIDEY